MPSVPWCTETLTMLGNDNVGNPAVFEQLLGLGRCTTASWWRLLAVT